jgi:O-acetylhomoserine/O-acetylserine sulfhydrylase-like pyridoxal-dependent enzyme
MREETAMKFETIAIHAGQRPDKAYGAVSPPIYMTSTFDFEDVGKT